MEFAGPRTGLVAPRGHRPLPPFGYLGIRQTLRILYLTNAEALGWLRGQNQAAPFNGQAPVELVTGGRLEELLATLRFLRGAEQGWFMSPLPEIDGDFASYVDVAIKGNDGGGRAYVARE